MLRASLKSLLARKLRLMMSAIAVVLGVAFVAGSFIFTDTLGESFTALTKSSAGDVVVRATGSPTESVPVSVTVTAERPASPGSRTPSLSLST